MSAHVLLTLLNELKRDKMGGNELIIYLRNKETQ